MTGTCVFHALLLRQFMRKGIQMGNLSSISSLRGLTLLDVGLLSACVLLMLKSVGHKQIQIIIENPAVYVISNCNTIGDPWS